MQSWNFEGWSVGGGGGQVAESGRDGEEAVPSAEDTRDFHERPSDVAVEVEARLDRGFALREKCRDPLDAGKL